MKVVIELEFDNAIQLKKHARYIDTVIYNMLGYSDLPGNYQEKENNVIAQRDDIIITVIGTRN